MKLILASRNQGKIKEITPSLQPLGISVLLQSQFNVPEVAETGLTFIENALIKARHAAHYTQYPVLADDSGVVIDILRDEPGVRSARYAGKHGNSSANIDKVLHNLADIPPEKRHAYFYCALVYLRYTTDPAPIVCTGIWPGLILEKPRGTNGFGYDPIFYLPEKSCSAAELDATEKQRISHRGQALSQLIIQLKEQGLP